MVPRICKGHYTSVKAPPNRVILKEVRNQEFTNHEVFWVHVSTRVHFDFHQVRCQLQRLSQVQRALHWPEGLSAGLTRDRLGGHIRPPQFFLNTVRGVTGIDAKLGMPFLTSNWRFSAKLKKISVIFWNMPIYVTQCHAIHGQKWINVWKIAKNLD